MLDTYSAAGNAIENTNSNRTGIDLRHPYQDQRLVEFAGAIPAYIMYNGQWKKYLVYRSTEKILPEPVRVAQSMGLLNSLYKRGLAEREQAYLRELLTEPCARWQQYVEPGILWNEVDKLPTTADDGSRTLIPWFCASMEMWHTKNRAAGYNEIHTIAETQLSADRLIQTGMV
jgi:asparagine synthetase B (glutamine-hydrolysing)